MNETVTALAGVRGEHAQDAVGPREYTVVLFGARGSASVNIAGDSPGAYNVGTALTTWQGAVCNAILLTGGGIYGLDVASGVRQCSEDAWTSQQPKHTSDPQSLLERVVAGAVIFDLLVGSATVRLDTAMGHAAAANASTLLVMEAM